MGAASAPPATRSLSTPFLSLEPINFSLTDGTNIPPPSPHHAAPPSKPKLTTTIPPPTSTSRSNSLAGFAGPLSSHPVTPIDSHPSSEIFPKLEMEGDQAATNGSKSSKNFSHALNASSGANTLSQSTHTDQTAKDDSRRPSLISRIMRLRSSSSLRSRSSLGSYAESTSSLHNAPSGRPSGAPKTTGLLDAERGIKRAAPSTPDSRSAEPATFPRMVKKKSMDLLGTARRKSGMWGLGDKAAQDEERRREEYMDDNGKPVRRSGLRKNGAAPPAVEVSGLDGGSFMNADLFKSIGKE